MDSILFFWNLGPIYNENNIEGFNIEDSIKITSDTLDHIVEWNTNSSLPKIPLKIKIHMQNAEIFSLWWS